MPTTRSRPLPISRHVKRRHRLSPRAERTQSRRRSHRSKTSCPLTPFQLRRPRNGEPRDIRRAGGRQGGAAKNSGFSVSWRSSSSRFWLPFSGAALRHLPRPQTLIRLLIQP